MKQRNSLHKRITLCAQDHNIYETRSSTHEYHHHIFVVRQYNGIISRSYTIFNPFVRKFPDETECSQLKQRHGEGLREGDLCRQ